MELSSASNGSRGIHKAMSSDTLMNHPTRSGSVGVLSKSLAQHSQSATTSSPIGSTNWSLWAMRVSIGQAILVTLLEIVIVILIRRFTQLSVSEIQAGATQFIHVYFALFIFALLFQALGSIDAYFFKNTMQVVGVAIFNAITVVYSIVQIFQIRRLESCYSSAATTMREGKSFFAEIAPTLFDLQSSCPFFFIDKNSTSGALIPTDTTDIVSGNYTVLANQISTELPIFSTLFIISVVIVLLMICFNLVNFFMSYNVYQEYGWVIYQTQGASIQKREMIRKYHLSILLLKFNIYFSVGIVVQFISAIYFSRKATSMSPRPLNFVLIPGIIVVVVSMIYYALGYYGLRRANFGMMLSFLAIMTVNLGAVIFGLVVAWTDTQFTITRIWLSSFIAVQILLNILTMLNGIYCMKDFNFGFKEVIQIMSPSSNIKQTTTPMRRVELD